MNIKPYKDFGDLLRTVFPFKVQKISIHAGFTCPNRDGTKGWGGCTYCNNQTFSPSYTARPASVAQQMEEGIRFFSRKYPQMKYIAYFQSYTNTYDSIENVLEKYREALHHPDVVGLIIGTRPDCMSDELLDELERITQNYFLLIEYGIESTDNATLKQINRGHSYEEAVETIRHTHARAIRCGAHLILGLPGESREMILSHADRISQLPLTTVKLHQLQLVKHTKMAQQYLEHPEQFHFYSVDEYIDLCIEFLQHLNPDFYIDRFVSQSPQELLMVPGWGLKNYEFTEQLHKRMRMH
ncbi:MAG: TIGR01212 family radical SAM protein [Dysgonamonadaceae bacterium]|nr:TIGR01212 family radical SAM protein [Dysgonamonadaceae bacterium]